MMASKCCSRNQRHAGSFGWTADGFTLIELLVVLVIIGVLLNTAYLSITSRSELDRLATEAKRMTAVARLARQQAIVDGRLFGFRMRESCYAFMKPEPDRWLLMTDELLGRHELPEFIRMEIRVEGVDVSGTKTRDEMAPQIIIQPSGEVTPFEVRFTVDGLDTSYRLTASLLGEFELVKEQANAR